MFILLCPTASYLISTTFLPSGLTQWCAALVMQRLRSQACNPLSLALSHQGRGGCIPDLTIFFAASGLRSTLPSAGERQREGADGARVLSNFVPNSIGIDLRRGMEMTQPNINYEPATCAYCGGRGDVDTNQCRACGSQGSVLVAQPARECVQCQGRGRKSAYRCNFCQGTGWARALKPGTR
jgi:hypothetical protein